MCDFCKLEQGVPGESYNDIPAVGVVKDGSTVVELRLWRYIDEDDYEGRTRALLMEYGVRLSDGLHTVAEEKIDIKYCPFCGEKL